MGGAVKAAFRTCHPLNSAVPVNTPTKTAYPLIRWQIWNTPGTTWSGDYVITCTTHSVFNTWPPPD